MSAAWLSWPRPPLGAGAPEPITAKAARTRLGFSGPGPQAIWEPRLRRLGNAAVQTELEQVRSGEIGAAVLWAGYEALAPLAAQLEGLGLGWRPLRAALRRAGGEPATEAEGEVLTRMDYAVIAFRPEDEPPDAPLEGGDVLNTCALFGYPPCCARAWAAALDRGLTDPLAAMLSDPAWPDETQAAGPILGMLGLGPFRHPTCRPGCPEAAAGADGFLQAMRRLGLDEEAAWLEAMATWAVEASVACGTAEVKTGVLRAAWLSDDLGPPSRRLHAGSATPDGAPAGLGGVFRPPAAGARPPGRRGPLTDEAALAEGWAAAGFDSAFALRSRFSCVVWEQGALLRRARRVLHLGCGDGTLLELLHQSRPNLKLYGAEADEGLAARTRARLGPALQGLAQGRWDEAPGIWEAAVGDELDITFVDPEPLVGAGCTDLFERIGRRSGATVVIASDRALRRFGNLEALAAAAGMSLGPGRPARVSAVVSR